MWQIWAYITKGRVEKGMVTTTLNPTQMIIVLLILQCHTCVHMHIAMIHSLDIDCPQSCTTSCIYAFGNTNPREIQLPFWCVALVVGYTTEVPTCDDIVINVYINEQSMCIMFWHCHTQQGLPNDPGARNLSPLQRIEQLIGDYVIISSQKYTVKHEVCLSFSPAVWQTCIYVFFYFRWSAWGSWGNHRAWTVHEMWQSHTHKLQPPVWPPGCWEALTKASW